METPRGVSTGRAEAGDSLAASTAMSLSVSAAACLMRGVPTIKATAAANAQKSAPRAIQPGPEIFTRNTRRFLDQGAAARTWKKRRPEAGAVKAAA